MCERRACIVCAVFSDNVFVLLCNEPLSEHRFHLPSPPPSLPSPPSLLPPPPSSISSSSPKGESERRSFSTWSISYAHNDFRRSPSTVRPPTRSCRFPVPASPLGVYVVAGETCISCLASNEATSVHLGKWAGYGGRYTLVRSR